MRAYHWCLALLLVACTGKDDGGGDDSSTGSTSTATMDACVSPGLIDFGPILDAGQLPASIRNKGSVDITVDEVAITGERYSLIDALPITAGFRMPTTWMATRSAPAAATATKGIRTCTPALRKTPPTGSTTTATARSTRSRIRRVMRTATSQTAPDAGVHCVLHGW